MRSTTWKPGFNNTQCTKGCAYLIIDINLLSVILPRQGH